MSESEEVKTCDRCEYWDIHSTGGVFGVCRNEKITNDVTKRRDGLLFWDENNHRSYSYTGPKFGCIHWKIKRGDLLSYEAR